VPETTASRWTAPPRPDRADGARRRVGVEIEFGNLAPRAAGEAVRARFGGTLRHDGAHRAFVEGTEFGDFAVEIDMSFAHRDVSGETERRLRDAVVGLSAAVVPAEIVCPPIAWDRAHALDDLIGDLRSLGAEGTKEGFFWAFGVQLNPEPPTLEVPDLLATLRAFALLREWLRDEIDVDTARRVWFFAAPFPDGWCARVLNPDYAPDFPTFVADYLDANATRDRELDLLPMLKHLDRDRVIAALPNEKINARPTWHYRLPNSEVGRTDWSIGLEWDRWVRVERLAEDRDRLAAAAAEWLDNYSSLVPRDWTPRARALAEALA